MTQLTEEMYKIFDQPEFSFKKIKESKSPDEVDQLKAEFKQVWEIWKKVNQNVATKLPEGLFDKVHVESWTNGWNLRDHFWASYRLEKYSDYNPCIGVMLDKKQLQVYLMFQKYKSEKRKGSLAQYNELLKFIPDWSRNIDLKNWYIWNGNEMESENHMPLSDYLKNESVEKSFEKSCAQAGFLVGKFAFRNADNVEDMEEFIASGIEYLVPLYQKL